MIRPKPRLVLPIVLAGVLALPIAGCATRRYVRQTVSPVDKDLSAYKTSNDDKVAAIVTKHDADISQVNERAATTNMKLDQTTQIAQQAQGTASRAMDATETNATKITSNSAAISSLSTDVGNALKYDLVTKTDVNFPFGKSTLTKEAQAALDEFASKAQPLTRIQVELAGFTDPVGSARYNLALSERRAEAVQRYLVMHNVPLRTIHIVGLGENAPPPAFADSNTTNASLSKADLHRLARRVTVGLYSAADLTQGAASRSQ